MLTIISIVVLAAFASVGAIYARFTSRPDLLLGLYVVFSCASQILAAKIASFDLYWVTVSAPAAVIVFSTTFLIQDVVNERFGRQMALRCIGVSLIAQLGLLLAVVNASALPPAPFWHNQSSWAAILGLVPRITLAGWLAFAASESLDAVLYARLRALTGGKFLWVRNFFSSLISLSVDTIVFVTVAFGPSPGAIKSLVIGQLVCKYLVAILSVPFMYLNRALLQWKPHMKLEP